MLTTSVCVRAPPAQGILWSLCLFYSASSLGSAYYQRETVRVVGAKWQRGPPLPAFGPLPTARGAWARATRLALSCDSLPCAELGWAPGLGTRLGHLSGPSPGPL